MSDDKVLTNPIKTTDKDPDSILQNVMKEIEKSYGKGAIMKLGDKVSLKIDFVSSGSLLIDNAIRIGGYPKGRIIEIYGPESPGETTLSLHAILEMKRNGGV